MEDQTQLDEWGLPVKKDDEEEAQPNIDNIDLM